MVEAVSKQKLEMVEGGCIGVHEAMKLMGIKSKQTLYKLMDSGQLPYSQLGPRGVRRIPVKKVHELLARNLRFCGPDEV